MKSTKLAAIVIFAPLCKAMSRVTGKSVIGLALSLACGLQLDGKTAQLLVRVVLLCACSTCA